MTNTSQVNNGQATVTLNTTGMSAGKYKFKTTYPQNDLYNSSQMYSILNLEKWELPLTITTFSSLLVGDVITISATKYQGASLKIYAGSTLKYTATLNSEIISTNITINNTNPLTAVSTYTKNNVEYTKEVIICDNIQKHSTTLILDSFESSFNSTETVTITGRLTDENGDGVVGNVKLVVGSGRDTVKTNDMGYISYEYNIGFTGEREIYATYNETTKYYGATSNTIILTRE